MVSESSKSGGDFLLFLLGFTRLIGKRYSILEPDSFHDVRQASEAAGLAQLFGTVNFPVMAKARSVGLGRHLHQIN